MYYHKQTEVGRSDTRKLFENRIQEGSGPWFGLGGVTPWPDEDNPPSPADTLNDIADIFALVYADVVTPVIEDANGEYSYGNFNYSSVNTDYTTNKLYIEGFIPQEEISNIEEPECRVYGLLYLPNFIEEPSKNRGEIISSDNLFFNSYILSWVANFSPMQISEFGNQTLKILREF
jgi:hypothetical protein